MYQPVDLQSLFVQFQLRYPGSSLITELVQIHEHHFIVRAIVQVGGVTLATSMATGATVELAEDHARSRLFSLLGFLPTPSSSAPSDSVAPVGTSGRNMTAPGVPSPQSWSAFPTHFSTADSATAVSPTPPSNPASATLEPVLPPPSVMAPPERSPESELNLLEETPLLSVPPSLDAELSSPASEPTPVVDSFLPTYPSLDLEITSPEADPYPPTSTTFPSTYDGLELEDTVAIDDEFPLEERLPPIDLPPVEAVVPSSRPTKSSRSKASKAATDTPNTPAPSDAPIDLAPLFLQIEQEMERIHWTKEQGRDHLKRTYGKRSRQQLTDEELLDFLNYLKARPLYEEV
ncbi:hypothetical protein ACN4EK_31240 [Pantanalinema rosaneae CENA516]|uniref:hypothetical protein n=1 Tax=Pantanalinema rosaneae TaxID=1620701 RepID=UPI003D6DEA7B